MRAVQDAQRGILASQFWASLCWCFERAEAELTQPEGEPADEAEDAPRLRRDVRGTLDGAQKQAFPHQRTKVGGLVSSAPLAVQGSTIIRDSHGDELAEATHGRLDCPQPPPPVPPEACVLSSPVAVDGRSCAAAQDAGNCAPLERPASAFGARMGCRETRRPAALSAWADVRQLIVFGLGSLESGANLYPRELPCRAGISASKANVRTGQWQGRG